jgi:hypothetical protein
MYFSQNESTKLNLTQGILHFHRTSVPKLEFYAYRIELTGFRPEE